MSKKFKQQASSARAAPAAFGSTNFGFRTASPFQTVSSPLSHVAEFPDLAAISEPSIIVAFKNLGKKDSVTKARALEELQEYLSSPKISDEGAEKGLLEAWSDLYPRISIENSRRVRLLAHSIQGSLTVSSGRRIVPYLPKLIGAWLSGTFDSDRGVSRSVHDGLEKSFPSEEKRKALWNVYKDQLLDYADDAILRQTPQTLSDERTTSPDDAEAKHVRVVANAIFMLLQLIKIRSLKAGQQQDAKIIGLIGAGKIWTFAYATDPYLRRGTYALLAFCGRPFCINLDWPAISVSMLSIALSTSQIGSSRQYSDALLAITEARPEVWTTDYRAKAPVSRRFFQYIKRGSQRGSEETWINMGQLIKSVPATVWSSKSDAVHNSATQPCAALLIALHEGVSNPEEPRANAFSAWTTYVSVCLWAADQIEEPRQGDDILDDHLAPIITQYVASTAQQSQWNIPSSASVRVCADCLFGLIEHGRKETFKRIWTRQVEYLIDGAKLSLPETSKDFTSSQDAVVAKSNRLSALHTEFLKALHMSSPVDFPQKSSFLYDSTERILVSCVDGLKSRRGKPYGSAAVVEAAIPFLNPEIPTPALEKFLQDDLPDLLDSPSSERLVSILFLCRHYPAYQSSFMRSALIMMEKGSTRNNAPALCRFLRSLDIDDLTENPRIEDFVLQELDLALRGDSTSWKPVMSLMENTALGRSRANADTDNVTESVDLQDRIFAKLIDALSLDSTQGAALEGFGFLLSAAEFTRNSALENFGGVLLSKLLVLSDSHHEGTADQAGALVLRLKKRMEMHGSKAVASSTADLIKNQLEGNDQPLSIFGLVDLARDTFTGASLDDKTNLAATIFPTTQQWQRALEPFVLCQPLSSSAITNPLQGLVYAVDRPQNAAAVSQPRDAEDLSLAFRLALYATKLTKSTNILKFIRSDQMRGLVLGLPQVIQYINDKITLDASNSVWLDSTTDVLDEAADLVVDGHLLISSLMNNDENNAEDSPNHIDVGSQWLKQLTAIVGTSAESYNLGQAFAWVLSEYVDRHGSTAYATAWEDDVKKIRHSKDLVKSTVLIAIMRDALATSTQGRRLCNELVADATEIQTLELRLPILRPLVLLNVLLAGEETLMENIPNQRVVFLLKTLARLLSLDLAPYSLISEVFKLLCTILPLVSDIYGDHWEAILDALLKLWTNEIELRDDLPALHSSLKVYGRLSSLARIDVNEDLLDVWNASKARLQAGLLKVLRLFQTPARGINQPREITAELLRRQLSAVDADSLAGVGSIYPLLGSEEVSIQSASYDLLHRTIPAAQEQISLDLVLEKTVVHLPAELMALLVDLPSTESLLTSKASQGHLWIGLRRYLLGWSLVFDHFTKASYRLKELYAADVQGSHSLTPFLDSLCVILRLDSGRPVDASKFNVTTFAINSSDSMEKEIQWLTTSLYYRCLLHLPGPTKDWFIEQKNRVKSPLESWTQKHISPLIVSASLETVTDWASQQDNDDRPITIKSSPKGSELTASIAIDEESPPISLSISLPGAYPLEQAIVTSRSRVGVSEKNWTSWLRTFQIIIFSSGSLIEGLIAFRRNVQGALKGQSECAICYSIIGTDMQTPNKKCGTCKNMFHSVCLYRWFKSSNSSSCPLCRNNFNYA